MNKNHRGLIFYILAARDCCDYRVILCAGNKTKQSDILGNLSCRYWSFICRCVNFLLSYAFFF